MPEVYRNLTRRCWSVRQGGRVVAHLPSLALADVTLVVREAARQRVILTGRREVHAWARGDLVQAEISEDLVEIGYSPWGPGFFTMRPGFHSCLGAKLIVFTTSGRAFARLE